MSKKKVEMRQKEIKQEVKVPIEWHIPDYIITRFASNMVVQKIENDFKILFFEVQPDIQLTPEPLPKSIKAECVASVIVTADRFAKFVEVLQKQLSLVESSDVPVNES